MQEVLVTGGAGFIGHHLVNQLIKQGHIVYLVDDMSNNVVDPSEYFGTDQTRTVLPQMISYYDSAKDSKNPKVVLINGDFASKHIVKLIENNTFSVVFHLAAKPRVEWTVENPIESTTENFGKVLRIAKACSESETRLVFSSTAAVYGNAETLPTTEKDQKVPTNPYGLAKLCTEYYLSLFEELYGLDWVALRYFNVYGPGQPGNSPYSTVVSAWCHRAKENASLRSDGDGEQTRDMIHVYDIVSANIKVANEKNLSNRVFNVGTGKRVSNNEILEYFKERGYTDVLHAPARIGDVKHTLADASCLEKLEWSAKINFADGLKEVLDYWDL